MPGTYAQYTTRRVLTSEWIEGEKLSQSRANDVASLVRPPPCAAPGGLPVAGGGAAARSGSQGRRCISLCESKPWCLLIARAARGAGEPGRHLLPEAAAGDGLLPCRRAKACPKTACSSAPPVWCRPLGVPHARPCALPTARTPVECSNLTWSLTWTVRGRSAPGQPHPHARRAARDPGHGARRPLLLCAAHAARLRAPA